MKKQDAENAIPPEVVVRLTDLLRLEWQVQYGRLLPKKPVYSILAGPHASRLRGRGLDFEEVRLYTPGDDIRNIDWRVTARSGRPYSKVFNEEKERPSFLVVDQSSWMFFGSQRFVKSVSAAHAAAIGAFYTVKRGDRVGGLLFSENLTEYFSPRRNRDALVYLLQRLVWINGLLPSRELAQVNTPFLNKALKDTASMITHDYVVTVISDFSAIDQETRAQLQIIRRHNDVILVHLYDPFDELLPNGHLVLGNGHRQITWNNRRHHNGVRYQQHFQQMKKQLTADFRYMGIPVVFFSTAESVEAQVQRHLGRTDV